MAEVDKGGYIGLVCKFRAQMARDFDKVFLYMQLSQSTSMRQEMRQLLTPRMIQSMEILQLTMMALEERIDQELENNPVLEVREGDQDSPDTTEPMLVSEDVSGRQEDR